MIKFRRKNYTIPEGHYTGPKDMDKVPGTVEMIAKGIGLGAGGGAIYGKLAKDTSIISGAITGAKWGGLIGLLGKLLLNYLHKPMSKIKYQEVDKSIRRQFGVYRMAGLTVGESLSKRASIEEKFSFNDRNVSSYKLNFSVCDNKITMYTFGISNDELDDISKILDYYCKKYFAMEYSAKLLNQRVNSYIVDIVFTNYQVISQLIIELSDKLSTKINLLDNDAIVERRLTEASQTSDSNINQLLQSDKSFSLNKLSISKYEIMKLLSKGIGKGLKSVTLNRKQAAGNIMQAIVSEGLAKFGQSELKSLGLYSNRAGDLDNGFLEKLLKKLRYIEGFNYTKGEETSELNISLVSGVFVITATKEHESDIDDKVYNHLKAKFNKSSAGNVVIYSHAVNNIQEFEMILKKVMSIKGKPNLYK